MKKILIIDDDTMVLLTLKRLLTKEGYKVIPANSGEAALQSLKGINFECDLILSDLKMPHMDGIEVIQTIRKTVAELGKAPIPEIIITGYAKEEIYRKAITLGASAYIDKPFDMKPLLETIFKTIGR